MLCGDALEVIRAVRTEVDFALELVDISGDPALETSYREHLPVVEIDGERAFTHFVGAEDFRARLEG